LEEGKKSKQKKRSIYDPVSRGIIWEKRFQKGGWHQKRDGEGKSVTKLTIRKRPGVARDRKGRGKRYHGQAREDLLVS